MKQTQIYTALLTVIIGLSGCQEVNVAHRGIDKVQLITLDPGHFHAALVQKTMYEQVGPQVHVYAPQGPDLQDHLNRVNGFNSRLENPTAWVSNVYQGSDFFEKMIEEQAGNVVVISGNNARKTDYIYQSVRAGFNVLADKPMVISPDKFPLLIQSFQEADKNGVLLYDIMTERFEITTILQKELAHTPTVFGTLQKGTPAQPAITKESVHHFFKYVAGNPLKRPGWFFDVNQQGEGLVDVSTHLVDLIQWECFPERIIDYKEDIEMLSARRWPTQMTAGEFEKVTQIAAFPDYLSDKIQDGKLSIYCNGEMIYKINGTHAKVSVIWNYQAPEGAGDTHYSIMRGSQCSLIIRQGAEENYKPVLYVEALPNQDIGSALEKTVTVTLQEKYPGISLQPMGPGKWIVQIPARYHVGHEAHFGQVMEKYLQYLTTGKLPYWEVPNMIAKYYTTTTAQKLADKQ
jgi:predicted dehydrogenase